jgi:hypothetical protein
VISAGGTLLSCQIVSTYGIGLGHVPCAENEAVGDHDTIEDDIGGDGLEPAFLGLWIVRVSPWVSWRDGAIGEAVLPVAMGCHSPYCRAGEPQDGAWIAGT